MRQSPLSPATAPESVRESVEPSVSPIPMSPTARPPCSGPAMEAAVGIRTWGSTVVVESAAVARVSVTRPGAVAATSSPAVVQRMPPISTGGTVSSAMRIPR